MTYRAGIILMFLFLFLNDLFAQDYRVSGKVVDKSNHHPLAFVNIRINEGNYGGTTDIDGNFDIRTRFPVHSLDLSYVGYHPEKYAVSEDVEKNIIVALERKEIVLDEVLIYPEENPAHRIIHKVVANRDANDPEKMESFSYTSYDKMIFTVNLDSLNRQDTALLSASEKELVDFFGEKDIFIMETVSERTFLAPDRDHEKVIATKVSGFRDPVFVFLISQIQSTSFYDELIRIADKNFVNPISKGSTRKYFFQIEDTTYSSASDSIFIISFRPRINTNFDGLKGVLMISSNGWAIKNVRAEPADERGTVRIRIQQMYEHIDGRRWFPVQLNTDVIFGNIAANTDSASYNLLGIGKSYLRDIELDPEIIRRKLGPVGVDVEPRATERKEEFWGKYRVDSLNARERKTYAFVDSIGREIQFDRMAKTFETVLRGSIPWKILDFHLYRLMRYNPYEGFYLGLGASTNEKLSRFISIGGFWGYGFKDQRAKFGGNLDFNIYRRNEVKLGFQYYNDVKERGGVRFFDDQPRLLRPDYFRNFLVRQKNHTESYNASLTFRALKHFTWYAGFGISRKEAFQDYYYGNSSDGTSLLMNTFHFTNLTLGTRFAFREKILRTPRAILSLGSDYPVLHLQYTRGFNNVMDGEFAYNRVDVKIEKTFYTKYLGETSLMLKGGYVDGDLPQCNLYNGNGSFRTFTVFAPQSFATMRMNEFLSNRYVALYFTHDFGNLLTGGEKFNPKFMISANAAFGDLNNTEKHFNTGIKTLEHGYYESGLLINNLLNLRIYEIGIGYFYRFGPYSYRKSFENMAFKISVVFPFQGFSNR
ncbi:MAG: DUF5686 family protein [Bacteroidales bacterium]